MLSLYKLEIFVSVVEEGSFTAAANRLYMTQSAVSQHIHDLEAQVGIALFERGRRGVQFTEAGQTLYDYALRILELVADAENAVTRVENLKSGQIKIGCTPGISAYMVPFWIQSFGSSFHNIKTELSTNTTGHIIELLLKKRIDIGFVEGELTELGHDNLAYMTLGEIAMFVVVGPEHPWWTRQSISASELENQPFISRQRGSQTRVWTDRILESQHIHARIVAEFDNIQSIKSAVASGMGITILPAYAIDRSNETMRCLSIEDMSLQRTLKLIWHKHKPFNAIVNAFLKTLLPDYPSLNTIVR